MNTTNDKEIVMGAAEKLVKETIAVRNLPEGTKAALAQLAEANGRSLEAEARHAIKQHLTFHLSGSVAIPDEDNQRDLATEKAEARVQAIQARCDSVKRKLNGGSKAVTFSDLRQMEKELTDARLTLGEVCRTHPLALLHSMQPLSSEYEVLRVTEAEAKSIKGMASH